MKIPFRVILLLNLLLICAGMATGCASKLDEDRPGVKEAKACMDAKDHHPALAEGLVIKACTHDGIWLADQYDQNGMLLKKFDFVNKEYAGPETGGGFVAVEALGTEDAQKFSDLRDQIQTILAKS